MIAFCSIACQAVRLVSEPKQKPMIPTGAITVRLIVKKMKNIVLLITDTFRYDNLGERARRPIRTPMLDKFEASRATAIDKFYMSSFPTVPHRTDIMTGTRWMAPLPVAAN